MILSRKRNITGKSEYVGFIIQNLKKGGIVGVIEVISVYPYLNHLIELRKGDFED